ncbi:MAG: hypothetical protein HYX76_07345, partial [Acidobacteria bacterium]|nr:hypothetical protein [Acidobacteriota bacterium]
MKAGHAEAAMDAPQALDLVTDIEREINRIIIGQEKMVHALLLGLFT